MSPARSLALFHAPNTRSSGTLALLEELQAPYSLRAINMKAGDQRKPEFLAVNPLGKVPAILWGDALVTEQVAIFIFLPDLFPKAGLAPAFDAPERGPYLRWIALYGSCFEPAVVDVAMKREPAPAAMSPYGTFDSLLDILVTQLRRGPYLLGERLSAADLLWGPALGWILSFKLVPELPEIRSYAQRIADRPIAAKVREQDAALAAEHERLAAA